MLIPTAAAAARKCEMVIFWVVCTTNVVPEQRAIRMKTQKEKCIVPMRNSCVVYDDTLVPYEPNARKKEIEILRNNNFMLIWWRLEWVLYRRIESRDEANQEIV